jgi:hypothetical protein
VKQVLRHQDVLDPLTRNKEALNAADIAKTYHFTELEDYLLEKVPALAAAASEAQVAEASVFAEALEKRRLAAANKREEARKHRAQLRAAARAARIQEEEEEEEQAGSRS